MAEIELDTLVELVAVKVEERVSRPKPPRQLLTQREVLDRLKISRSRLWDLRRKGWIQDIQIPGSRSIRFEEAAVEALLDRLQAPKRPTTTLEGKS